MNKTGKIISAFAAGAAAGVVLGLLFAPAKGSETREKIKNKANNLAEDLQDEIARAEQKLQDLKQQFETAIKDQKQKFT